MSWNPPKPAPPIAPPAEKVADMKKEKPLEKENVTAHHQPKHESSHSQRKH